MPELIRDKASRLFRYLNELAGLRTKTVRDVASYDTVFWFSELPQERECRTAAWNENEDESDNEDEWLRIDKPKKLPLPLPPAECKGWFEPSSLEDTATEPKLLEEIVDSTQTLREHQDADIEPEPPVRLRLIDHPHIASAWRKYIESQWRPWSKQCEQWERVQKPYRKLFAICQEQQRRGEQYELILGVGTFLWIDGGGHRTCRPIVTARATIDLDGASGRITVGPAVDGADFTLEQDMLEDGNNRPPSDEQKAIEQEVSALEFPWRPKITNTLRRWVQTLRMAADGEYFDSLECPSPATQTPQMAFAPVLILRRRGVRTMQDALKKVATQLLCEETPIPSGIRRVCGDGNEPIVPHDNTTGIPAVPDEILFPLPTNDEQLAIIRRLDRRSGVLVQGPPGTGKSHTIVNLICHLLASGKRVLVTSQTPRALRVLRRKIEKELPDILPLTVSLLGEDAESRQNLEQSVQGILHRVNAADGDDVQQRIEWETRNRQSHRSRLAELRRRLREVREAETTTYAVPGTSYEGTAQAIAEAVSRDEERFSWLPDSVAEESVPPLTVDELKELHSLSEQNHSELLRYGLPDCESLPTAEDFENAINASRLAREKLERLGGDLQGRFAKYLPALDRTQLQQILQIAQQETQLAGRIAERQSPWTDRARQEIGTGRGLPWRSLAEATAKAVESLTDCDDLVSETDLELPVSISREKLLADASGLLAHLESGGIFGFWPFRRRVVKRCAYVWRDCRFAGKPCNSPDVLKSLVGYLQTRKSLNLAWQEWAEYVELSQGTVRNRLAQLQLSLDTLRGIFRLHALRAEATRILGETEKSPEAADCVDWGRKLADQAKAAIAMLDVDAAQAVLTNLSDAVALCRNLPNPHPLTNALIDAAEPCNAQRYREHLTTLTELHQQRRLAQRCLDRDQKLRVSAPLLADAIKTAETRAALAEHLDLFAAAWAWRKAKAWLARFATEHSADDIIREVSQAEQQLHKTTEALVAMKAWKSCQEKLASNPSQRGALVAWQQKVKKIGRGTGKHAETHRRDARKYMQECRGAIPAWIMPLHRVAEQVEVEPEVFDVVIVDEASQTGPEGLFLQYLGKQCIVVGDDKQISPEAGFVDGGQVRMLMTQYLAGIPFAETLDPATSFFDQAAIRYGSRVTLQEHFRCMPEIIRFSNDLCYADTPLKPLRQYPPARLTPIQVRFVTDGYREGDSQNAINRPEAAAVAKSVIDCLADPRYKGKSFGVICLQGHAQSQLIENMILDAVGPEPFKNEKNRLLCGDSYSFQGDERDVMFLSMVAALDGERRPHPLTRETFEQRFNVAVSRARDQVWLFHSVREGDLHPKCMRRRLLHFCHNPDANASNHGGDHYESQFERDIGEALSAAGFRVISQYRVADYRIDLVVEDRERRIAIECDGDNWHGPEQYEADMARQRMLERCGWKFLRIRGCVFYANRSKTISELIAAIGAHGIQPHAFTDNDSAARDWVEDVSGNQCMDALGTHAVDAAEENVVQQQEMFSEEPQEAGEPVPTIPAIAAPVEPPLQEIVPTTSKDHGETPVTPTPGPPLSDVELLVGIDSCLEAASEPLERKQIEQHIKKMDSAKWDTAISQLIHMGLVVVSGTAEEPRYSLLHKAASATASVDLPSNEGADFVEVVTVESTVWFQIAHWAKENDFLEGWQRGIAYSLGVLKRQERFPTPKQARQGKRILDEARRLGFVASPR